MLSLLRQRNFALLWLATLISLVGDWMVRISLSMYIYELTGSTLATGLMFMAGILPQIILGSVAGVFVDRWDQKRTIVITKRLLGWSSILFDSLTQTSSMGASPEHRQ